jgi:hypothetical protein
MAAVGWGEPMAWAELRGHHYGALARVIAAILGLPVSAIVGLGLTVLVSVAQAVAGYWLATAFKPTALP